ncbi:SDR family NAD(P)-dependent oxidoreductase [Phreatobacter stygius]|uniref:SDR family NAD(P)-dependent oxidoreductase n=1 Tax=Phreatobacter stygius TaxID=1940610 RepID=A0A4D7AYL3_9HYPH|nr:SDR family NAD(P)-dependent oxidoreductase [Phreatobacter stygius]QCI64495.1 SDR family NAD(P)-dependent oxidoreductase [Phreatobacter stygius]
MPAAVVTGVSTGIGEAIAADLTRRGWRVFGTVRRVEDRERLKLALGENFTGLIADVTDIDSLGLAATMVADALGHEPLAGLVCNAGVSLPGPLLHQPLDELDQQWNVNVRGLVATVQAFAGLLGASERFTGKPGRIVTMSSVSGELVWPFVGGYAASKHAVEAVSHALRRELMPFGVDVVIIGPGPVATPIWEKSSAAIDRSRYQATFYGPIIEKFEKEVLARANDALPAEAVADVVFHALTTAKPKTRYPLTRSSLTNWTLPRLLPDRVLDRLAAKRLGLNRRK